MERVIQDFNSGLLDAAPGTTLRSYLAEALGCDPMRITKKFTGDASIGKRVFHPREHAAAATLALTTAFCSGVNCSSPLSASLVDIWGERLSLSSGGGGASSSSPPAIA